MTWVIGAVTLPVAPSRVTLRFAADVKEIRYPTAKSIIMSLGSKMDKLKIEGTIVAAGQTAAQLEANYITPLANMVYTEVTINVDGATARVYDDDWVVSGFESREVGGFTTSFRYSMEFIRGSSHTVIT